ncbi:hypothetical protein EBR78_07595 [bacterium]|nr:hypothetical protein [bacterium]
MIRDYTCYISGACLKNGEGKWAVLSCPNAAKWTVSLSGSAKCKDVKKLYLLAALAALDDLTVRCSVTLVVDNMQVLNILEEIGTELESEESAKLISKNALIKQFDRHNITLSYIPLDADKRWKEVIATLRAV